MTYRRNRIDLHGMPCFLTLVGFSIIHISNAYALVETENLNYFVSSIDFVDPSGFTIERSYNSRSSHDGFFGFGWCSDLETNLSKAGRNIELQACGGGVTTIFEPAFAAPREGVVRKVWRSRDGSEISLDESNYQITFARPPDNRFQVPIAETFNLYGQVTAVDRIGFGKMEVEWQMGRIADIALPNGRKLSLNWGLNGKILSIMGAPGERSDYWYDENGRLISVKNMWGNTYGYEYDSLYNLTREILPDGTSMKVEYDTVHDWVTDFWDRDNCHESYRPKLSIKDHDNHYWTYVTKICGDGKVHESLYEYIFRPNSSNVFVLWRKRETVDGKFQELTYSIVDGSQIEATDKAPIVGLHKPQDD